MPLYLHVYSIASHSAIRNQYDGSRSFLYNIVKEQHEHFSWETGKVYYLGVDFENGIQIEIIPNKYVDYKYQVVCIDLSQNNRLSTNTRTLRSIRKFRNDVVNKNNYRNNIKKLDDVIVELSEREATNKLADVNCQDNILEPLSLGNLDIRFTNYYNVYSNSYFFTSYGLMFKEIKKTR